MTHWQPAANRNTLWCAVFVEALHQRGLSHAVIAPGSRSTPLTLALAAHPGIRTHLLIDERGAAFYALGLAKASGRPVALVCTSGTAAANFHPAVAEADLSEVPLLVLTADRPPMLRGVGAAQTLDQLGLYGSAVRWFHEVGEPVMADGDLRRLRSLAGQALLQACRAPAGPVHLNFPFRKPLEAQAVPGDVPPELAAAHLPTAHGSAPAQGLLLPAPAGAGASTLGELAARMRAAPRGLILCGPMAFAPHDPADGPDAPRNRWPKAVAHLARATGYPVLAEPPSGAWHGVEDTAHLIPHVEAVLRANAFRKGLAPQLVLRFGAMPTPRHVEVLLDEHPDCPVVLVHEGGRWLEPTHHPTDVVCAEPARFCTELAAHMEGLPPAPSLANADGSWLPDWQRAGRLATEAIDAVLEAPPPDGLGGALFEGRVLREIAAALPPDTLQFTASSMPVRDLADFTAPSATPVTHLVNRGANGIDGTLASALGAAAARPGHPAVLVVGDVALHHDATSLLALRDSGLPLTVVLINNDGGGIFEMLPIAQYGDAYERFFGTPHGTDFAALCAAYGVAHERVTDWPALGAALRASLAGSTPRVIEVCTDRQDNRAQHELVWRAVAGRLAQAFASATAPHD